MRSRFIVSLIGVIGWCGADPASLPGDSTLLADDGQAVSGTSQTTQQSESDKLATALEKLKAATVNTSNTLQASQTLESDALSAALNKLKDSIAQTSANGDDDSLDVKLETALDQLNVAAADAQTTASQGSRPDALSKALSKLQQAIDNTTSSTDQSSQTSKVDLLSNALNHLQQAVTNATASPAQIPSSTEKQATVAKQVNRHGGATTSNSRTIMEDDSSHIKKGSYVNFDEVDDWFQNHKAGQNHHALNPNSTWLHPEVASRPHSRHNKSRTAAGFHSLEARTHPGSSFEVLIGILRDEDGEFMGENIVLRRLSDGYVMNHGTLDGGDAYRISGRRDSDEHTLHSAQVGDYHPEDDAFPDEKLEEDAAEIAEIQKRLRRLQDVPTRKLASSAYAGMPSVILRVFAQLRWRPLILL